MSSSINLYDSLGNPFELTGDMVKELVGIDSKQLATAWVNFNSDGTINNSYNVSDVSVGSSNFDIGLVGFDNENYTVSGGGDHNGFSVNGGVSLNTSARAYFNCNVSLAVGYKYSVVIFGGKA